LWPYLPKSGRARKTNTVLHPNPKPVTFLLGQYPEGDVTNVILIVIPDWGGGGFVETSFVRAGSLNQGNCSMLLPVFICSVGLGALMAEEPTSAVRTRRHAANGDRALLTLVVGVDGNYGDFDDDGGDTYSCDDKTTLQDRLFGDSPSSLRSS
jgi:hypothetical protein